MRCRLSLILAGMVVALPVLAEPPATVSPATTPAAAGMIDVRTLVPDLAEDMRYAGSDNFTGTVVDGYDAPRCYLRKGAATALARVEHTLRQSGMRLKLWDCYRPARAVAVFVRWAHDLSDTGTKAVHYPNIDKSALLGEYIAPVSGHSKGATVDLTLMQCHAGKSCVPLDMGTDFDFFDPMAHTDAATISPTQKTNRLLLKKAMEGAGFVNYPQEWWHYSLPSAVDPGVIYDVPVR
ncbi:D-alanyl-D-alanine dipeptidase [Luteibacter sp. Sphag1AF]|uniref:M15 family metallopeptidase n=1 Tax=Luteibacter sp. Sphag1AF TaxID=2587031 RepID=UPI00160BD115|nr:M15 family metallopeptidase [Luteibacter sp. Sphag1AF]MBB3227589.1 D-alanyl-D-alanine dipeptidase [Luteibacter sp. Sphag1AF]